MGAGFYMMIVMSIIMYRVALADKKTGWIWSGIYLCVAMLLGKLFGLTVMMTLWGFALTFLLMFGFNLLQPSKK